MKNHTSSPKRSICSSITGYVVLAFSVFILILGAFSIHLATSIDRSTCETLFNSYFSEASQVVNQHTSYVSNIVNILQDTSAIRMRLNQLYLSNNTDRSSESISDVVSVPFTYYNSLCNFSVNAVSIYFGDDLIYYSLPRSGLDIALDRSKTTYEAHRDGDLKDGMFFPSETQQPAYSYWVQDYRNIYNGRYYGKIVIELLQIPANTVNEHTTYLEDSTYALDLASFPSAKFYIYNENGQIVFSNESFAVGQSNQGFWDSDSLTTNTDTSLDFGSSGVTYRTVFQNTGLTLYATIDKTDYSTLNLLSGSILFLALTILYLLFLSLFIQKRFHPLTKFSEYCRLSADQDPPSFPPLDTSYSEFYDISQLAQKINKYVKTCKEESQRVERESRSMQMQILNSQMDPHFLFNMLDVINWKAVQSNSTDVSSMIEHLSNILRYEIRQDQPKILLRQELNYIYQYLGLQKLCNPQRFDYTISADNEMIDQYYIPKLILQPIVENALVHGILPSDRKGNIKVEIWEDDEGIMCRVSDNGVGFDSASLEQPQEEIAFRRNHIALRNIRQRLQLLYGAPYGLLIHSTPGAGTVVSVYIPFDTTPPEKETNRDV